MPDQPLILILGVCAAGKSTLSQGLRALGYNARSLAQEHSASPRLWKRYKPDILIMLDCQYDTIRQRKQISWGLEKYHKQKIILNEAFSYADLVIPTDQFTPVQLVDYTVTRLAELGIKPVKERDHGNHPGASEEESHY